MASAAAGKKWRKDNGTGVPVATDQPTPDVGERNASGERFETHCAGAGVREIFLNPFQLTLGVYDIGAILLKNQSSFRVTYLRATVTLLGGRPALRGAGRGWVRRPCRGPTRSQGGPVPHLEKLEKSWRDFGPASHC